MFGAGFHLWKDGGLDRLLLYEVLSGMGFWGGHTISSMIGWDFWKLGPLHLGFAILWNIDIPWSWILAIDCSKDK